MTQSEMSLTVFDPIKKSIEELKQKDASLAFDHTTEDGEKGLRSWVQKMRSYKGEIAAVHKETKADALSFGRSVDAMKNELTAGVDELIKERMKPLDEIKEKKRAAAEAIIETEHKEAEQKETDRQADLKEREETVAKKEAELKAKEDAAKKVQEEKDRIEREKGIAEKAAEKEKMQAAIDKEKALEKAEREKQEAIDAEKTKAAEIKADLIAEEKKQAAIEAKRVANKKHRLAIEDKVHARLYELTEDLDAAARIMFALEDGTVPNLTIAY